MNPLMEALRRTEDGRLPLAERGVDQPFGSEAFAHEPSRGGSGSDAGATDPDGIAWPYPLRIGDEAENECAPPEPASAAAAAEDAGAQPPSRPSPEGIDVRNPHSAPYRVFDPRMLPRRRGAGRTTAVALSLLAVIGAMTGGGYHLWTTQLVRPGLVPHLPRMQALVAEMAPVRTASAAPAEAAGPALGTPVRQDVSPAVPSVESVEGSPVSAQAPAVEPGAGAVIDSSTEAAGGPAVATEDPGPEPGPDDGPLIEISKGIRDDRVAASLERAHEAFVAGDLESAAEAYRAVARHEPGNRDALLGLAAAAARAGRWDEAAGHYARVLASHPADTVAQAALIAIEEQDPVRGESRLKALLWREPEAAHLHFGLGNVYAAQSRWPEAQRSYLDAYRFDRENADYAYNLAVSLDHLARRESALGFYREALALARSRPAGFEAVAVLARIREIGASAGEGATLARPSSEPAGADPATVDR